MEKLSKGDRFEWVDERQVTTKVWYIESIAADDSLCSLRAEGSDSERDFYLQSHLADPKLWRRLPRESICGACLGVDGCAKCKPKPALPEVGRRVTVSNGKGWICDGTVEPRKDGRPGIVAGHVAFNVADFAIHGYAWDYIADAPADVEAPKPHAAFVSGWQSSTECAAKHTVSVEVAKPKCDPRCVAGKPCRRVGCLVAERDRLDDIMAARGNDPHAFRLPLLTTERAPQAIDTAAPDPLAAYLHGNGVCVMRGRRGL